ncbi:hypothetical protein ABID82_004254 [Methylobacterium sp. PvP062]|uniref:Uncharacterized protein n=1 Tax=Methylobacterium radiotolerans TaxID=31998 RepID=A0ABV2NLF3_9HYPH|nr:MULTISPECIES: hypothetical protein [unclassified Methylobacterium]KZC01418.1 hypothetical protein AU375_02342 [Methylobacterium radiotolerans]MBP2496016.1 hypothetical protein [Methylobacterium sp. PvP105]MBP2504113.1 hypothetical protein [Methylobacterium sp. PvP109]MCX7333097.1 hypothetical protein [Hyphomicrobiales bacterium]
MDYSQIAALICIAGWMLFGSGDRTLIDRALRVSVAAFLISLACGPAPGLLNAICTTVSQAAGAVVLYAAFLKKEA